MWSYNNAKKHSNTEFLRESYQNHIFLSTKNISYKVCCIPEITTTRKLIFFFTKTDRRKKFKVYISTYNHPLH